MEDRDLDEPQMPVALPRSKRRKPAWARDIIQGSERYGAEGKRESKKPKLFSSYIAHMCNLVDDEPDCFEEAVKKQESKDAMVDEYQSILKNNVWDVVPRAKDKSVVSSKWIFKTKHAVDGSIEIYKARFVARGFS